MGRFWSVWLTGFLAGPSTAAPVGLALRLPAWATVLAVSASAWLSFVIALFAMEWLRRVRTRRALRVFRFTLTARLVRRVRRAREGDPEERAERDAARRAARLEKARRLLTRFGPAGFGLVGPALFGTWVSAVLGSALGLARQRLLAWLVVGATTWSALLVLATHTAFGWLFT
ncbi:hypothetical protein [Actinophytocola algeriensis]|uniref:Small multi-drug export protein n=1 Tax=Actinophytocola algeriensis TaxID=1768010 RepID=A0A7W7Q9H9_9PSEU|nr:hypothetical protein [Actinophytocola algeriensis]MBB4909474.1 hypothetical protein [Actinophytocola algeriensis]MBE1475464.1 hypothetical protein [Actinophytocola algeriensis]